jgi:hypothetical protein
MMGRQDRDQRQLFYEFSLDDIVPADHLLRRINVFATAVLADLHQQMKALRRPKLHAGRHSNSSATRPPAARVSVRFQIAIWSVFGSSAGMRPLMVSPVLSVT